MKHNYLLFLLLFCCVSLPAGAWQQQVSGSVGGIIKAYSGEPVAEAAVQVAPGGAGTTTDESGRFLLSGLQPGKYTLTVKAVGYNKREYKILIKEGETAKLDAKLESSIKEMEAVSVLGRNINKEVSRQSYNVTSVDAAKLHNTTLDLSHALDRVAGIRVREDGGIGSNMNFSLNGFTGKQVKFFIDGVPMENFGTSFQINNIPINMAERIEIYKGVVPVWLGADALGGAVNIVTNNKPRTYLDLSYSYGSFNTHKSTLNAGYIAKSGFTAMLNAFQNYSDNNYWMTVDVADINTGQYYRDQRVRRFHDQYRNETVIGQIGFRNKKFADEILLGMTLGQNHADIQTGARQVNVYGKWFREGNIMMPSLKYYKRNLFVKGLDLRINANYNLGEELNVDTFNRRYNWFQQYKDYSSVGAGGERSLSLYKYRNNNGVGTATLSYKLNDHHSLVLNNVFSTFNRKGTDLLNPNLEKYEQPQKLQKNITGLSYKFDPNKRWSTSAFVKYFWQRNLYSESYNPTNTWGSVAYRQLHNDFNDIGYGIASSYYLTPKWQLKASAERSYRLPENNEIFGDVVNLIGNMNLKPEQSENYNLGMNYNFHFEHIHRFSLEANILYRNVHDFIRQVLASNQIQYTPENRGRVTNMGLDAELRYSYKRLLTAGVNVTYQNLRNQTKYEVGETTVSPVYKDRIPNMPFLFGNADASVFIDHVGGRKNTLSIGYNMLYVHASYLYWPSQGSDKLDIPAQLAHDINVVYAIADGKYNIALECKNLTDAKVYDNFMLQKPGRAFNVKLRYFIQKQL